VKKEEFTTTWKIFKVRTKRGEYCAVWEKKEQIIDNLQGSATEGPEREHHYQLYRIRKRNISLQGH